MSNPRYVMAHGKRILVETLDITPRQKKQAAKQQEAYAQVPLLWATEMAKLTKTPRAMVWIILVYLAWKNNSATFVLSNELLRRYGVTRFTKYRALETLEAAGEIGIERRGKQALIITLVRAPMRHVAQAHIRWIGGTDERSSAAHAM